MRKWLWILAMTLPVAPVAAWAEGLTASRASLALSRWQTRVEVDAAAVRANLVPLSLGASQVWQSTRLFTDYHLDTLKFGQTSGLKLTSGLVLTQRGINGTHEADSRSAWPYLGVGYSGNGVQGDWGFSADIGMAAQSLGATARLGRVFGGGLSVSDAVRDLNLQPVVRLGVTYSF